MKFKGGSAEGRCWRAGQGPDRCHLGCRLWVPGNHAYMGVFSEEACGEMEGTTGHVDSGLKHRLSQLSTKERASVVGRREGVERELKGITHNPFSCLFEVRISLNSDASQLAKISAQLSIMENKDV